MVAKLKRPQTIIGIGSVIVGLSYFLAEVFSGGIRMIYPFSLGQWVSLVGIAIGIGLILWGLLKEESPVRIFKTSTLYDIMPILREMDRYLWQLAEKQRIINVDIEKFNNTSARINELLGIKMRKPLNPNQTITQLTDKVRANIKKTEKEVLELLKQEKNKLELIKDITKILDANGYGLKKEKESDRKYLRFKKMIAKYYDDNKHLIDKGLQSLITLHVDISEYFANGLLVLKRIDFITTRAKVPRFTELVPASAQAKLEGLKTESDLRLNEIRVSIAEYIREIERIHERNK